MIQTIIAVIQEDQLKRTIPFIHWYHWLIISEKKKEKTCN